MRIVSIGEILFDCFQDKKVIGGAPFNFFYHVYKLTNNAEFISRIGNDDDGKSIIDFFRKNDMNNDYIQIDYEHQTGIVLFSATGQFKVAWILKSFSNSTCSSS